MVVLKFSLKLNILYDNQKHTIIIMRWNRLKFKHYNDMDGLTKEVIPKDQPELLKLFFHPKSGDGNESWIIPIQVMAKCCPRKEIVSHSMLHFLRLRSIENGFLSTWLFSFGNISFCNSNPKDFNASSRFLFHSKGPTADNIKPTTKSSDFKLAPWITKNDFHFMGNRI